MRNTALSLALLAATALAACSSSSNRQPAPSASTSASAAPAAAASGPAAETPSPVPTAAWADAARADAITAGKAVLVKHECVRCHTIDDLPAATRPLGCTSCHQFLTGLKPEDRQRKAMVEKYGEEVIARYQRNIQHLIHVPDLTLVARRVSPFFLRTFLEEPFDVRPGLSESMIRHALTPDEIRAVVRYFAAKARADDPYADGAKAPPLPDRPAHSRIEEGKKKLREKGCATCHTFGNVDLGVAADVRAKGGDPAKLAPNLRFVRDRTRRDVLAMWIREPAKIAPGTLMPAMGVSEEDASLIADFLLFGDPQLVAQAPVVPKLPKLLTRPVPYEEMKEAVLGKICVHCHMNDYEKDPGPGNKGGLGYKGDHLQMRTYETLVFGMLGPDGKRRSVLEKQPGEELPRVLQVMLDRKVEEARDHVADGADHERPHYPKTLGMPLGLPSMSDEQVALLATWISQGCKGPTKVTGMKGVDDGYLVPDGPIKKNQGCEVRAPAAKRPDWAVDAAKPAAPQPSASK